MNAKKTQRLLQALEIVQGAGAKLEPIWNPHTRLGVEYQKAYTPRANELLYEDLEELAQEGYLERIFVDRLSLCPKCESHTLNMREICTGCFSAHLMQMKAIFHFRCGFVGPASAFEEEAQGRRCPKCHKLLQDLGTDHDSPGTYFVCNTCNANFQIPEVGALCLSCGVRFSGAAEMQSVRQRDVFAYRLPAAGREALHSGKLLTALTSSEDRV